MIKFNKKYLGFLWPLGAVVCNLLLAYVVYFTARVVFLFENWQLYAENMTNAHLLELFRGGIMFDTSAILYTNALWVVMVLLPYHKKDNERYHRVCRWVFVVINILTLAINL